MSNTVEMNADTNLVVKTLNSNSDYKMMFRSAFISSRDSAITMDNVAKSLAAYIRTLSPMNSAFDQYMAGDRSALSAGQIKGFNLFMGKAQCGTCHFAPLFNGLVPPFYNRTEVEILGIPSSDDFTNASDDKDRGLYQLIPSKYFDGAFKTPTVRNAAVTAPYMHNGSFRSMEKVIDFYNKGGGIGLGLNVEAQTLSPLPLNLNQQEIKDIISFMESLTDSISKEPYLN
jgi:cytochrome c peroxidase